MDAIFGVHNRPGIAAGKLAGRAGALYAAADKFEIVVTGKGGHAARPHLTVDPVLVAAQIIVAVQSIVPRNSDPMDAAVVSTCKVEAGPALHLIALHTHKGSTGRPPPRATPKAPRHRAARTAPPHPSRLPAAAP